MNKKDESNLKKRYLIWLYKTTKEALDKIERKFTQLEIDRFILKELKKQNKNNEVAKFIEGLDVYIRNKEKDGLNLKYLDKKFPAGAGSRHRREKPEYQFLVLKLNAIEKVITKELGKTALLKIKDEYEEEMTRRILEERQGRT